MAADRPSLEIRDEYVTGTLEPVESSFRNFFRVFLRLYKIIVNSYEISYQIFETLVFDLTREVDELLVTLLELDADTPHRRSVALRSGEAV